MNKNSIAHWRYFAPKIGKPKRKKVMNKVTRRNLKKAKNTNRNF